MSKATGTVVQTIHYIEDFFIGQPVIVQVGEDVGNYTATVVALTKTTVTIDIGAVFEYTPGVGFAQAPPNEYVRPHRLQVRRNAKAVRREAMETLRMAGFSKKEARKILD